MIDLLQLTNLYAREKIEKKFPCVKEDPTLFKELYKAFILAASGQKRSYDLLKSNIDECIKLVTHWQTELTIPEYQPEIAQLYQKDFKLEEVRKTPGGCSKKEVKKIYAYLSNLWIAFIAVYEENNDTDLLGHTALIKRMQDEVKESAAPNEVKSKKSTGKMGLIILLILFGLLIFGFWFFQSGSYKFFEYPFEQTSNTAVEASASNAFIEGDSTFVTSHSMKDTFGLMTKDYKQYIILKNGGEMKVAKDSVLAIPFLDKVNQIDNSEYIEIKANAEFLKYVETREIESFYLLKKDSTLHDSAVISITKI